MDGRQSPLPQQPGRAPEREGSHNYDIERMGGAGDGEWWPNASSEALLRYDDRGSLVEPMLRKRTMNTTSQIAVVGANVCPIESLDYEYAALQSLLNFILVPLTFRIRSKVLLYFSVCMVLHTK